jgi:hypothetical protein
LHLDHAGLDAFEGYCIGPCDHAPLPVYLG